MESEPLQRVSVVKCNHTTAGGCQTPVFTGRPWKASLEFKIPAQVFWAALETLKRQDGVGATPKGQCRPVRPYDSWRQPDAISDPEALESVLEVSASCPSLLECKGECEEERWSRCLFKGSASPSDHTNAGGPNAILDRESLEIWRGGGTARQLFGVKRKTVRPSQGLTSLDT